MKTDPRLLIRKSLVRAQPGEPIFFRICSSGSFDTCGKGARLVPCRAGTEAGRRPDLSRWPGDLSSRAGADGVAATASAASAIASGCPAPSSSASTNVRLLVGSQRAYHWSVVVGLLWPRCAAT